MYEIGDIIGPDKRFMLVRRDDSNTRYGFFIDTKNEIKEEFRARIDSVVDGGITMRKMRQRIFWTTSIGKPIGDFINPDGTRGAILVNRQIIDGTLSQNATFICPIDGVEFIADANDVLTGKVTCCHKCAVEYGKRTKHHVGDYVGNFSNGTGYPSGGKIVDKSYESGSLVYTFECPVDGTRYVSTINSMRHRKRTPCPICYPANSRKYQIGDYLVRSDKNGIEHRIKVVGYNPDDTNLLTFECMQDSCTNSVTRHISSAARSLSNGKDVLCDECLKQIKEHKKQATAQKAAEKAYAAFIEREHQRKKKADKELLQEEKRRKAELREIAELNAYAAQNWERMKKEGKTAFRGNTVDEFLNGTSSERGYGPKTAIGDIAGTRMNRLCALHPLDGYSKTGQPLWVCQCDCGNRCVRQASFFCQNKPKASCGCQAAAEEAEQRLHNMEGMVIGHIHVLKLIGKRDDGRIWYRVRYDDENHTTIDLRQDNIRNPRYQTPPYSTKSMGEHFIEEALRSLHKQYYAQFSFDSLINPATHKKLVCDFYLPNDNVVIEFDGKQHYQEWHQWGGERRLLESMYYDVIKNKWCLEHNMCLIRIPYCYRDQINSAFISELLDSCKHEKQVFLPVEPKTDDHRIPVMMKTLAHLIAAVAEQKRTQEEAV